MLLLSNNNIISLWVGNQYTVEMTTAEAIDHSAYRDHQGEHSRERIPTLHVNCLLVWKSRYLYNRRSAGDRRKSTMARQ